MGKGDKRTKRGKIHIGSTGVVRQKKKAVAKKISASNESAKIAVKKVAAKKATKKAD